MSTVFLALLLVGLVLGVFAMLYGTERKPPASREAPHERKSEHNPAAEPSPLFNVASVGAFIFFTGVVGYLLVRYTGLGQPVIIGLAAGAGLAAFVLQSLLIARWAIPGAREDHIDERYLLQGTLGRVIREIPVDGVTKGEIRYALEGKEYALPALNIETGAIAAGTEVVIERIEDGVAYVELWAQVEQRL